MLATCPPGTDDETIQQCGANYTAERMFRLPPVTSLSTKLTYRNKFCAECHNDTDTLSWSLSIDCYNQTVDLNYLNSYAEIFTKADKYNCSIMYHELNDPTSNIMCDSPVKCIGECNITGTWEQYDADIEMACGLDTEFEYMYTAYRNIFCKLCNPPEKVSEDNKLIDGSASNIIAGEDPLLDACFQYDETPWLHPYKNVFCYVFTMRNTHMNPELSLDEDVNIINDTIKYYAILKNLELSHIPRFDTSSEIRHSVGDHLNSLVNSQGNKVDIEKLLHLHFLHYGLQERCNSTMIHILEETNDTSVQTCGCEIDCIVLQNCCVDFAFSKPISMVSVFDEDEFLVGRCYGRSSGNISKLCEGNGTDTNINALVHVPIEYVNNIFKNIYCFACNHISFTYNDTTEFMSNIHLDSFDIFCNFFPNINPSMSSFQSLVRFFHRYPTRDGGGYKFCRIRRILEEFSGLYSRISSYGWSHTSIERCNVTGEWQTYDADIEWACHNFLAEITPFPLPKFPYLNIFCHICNMDERLLDSENMTLAEDSCSTSSPFDTVNPLMETLCYNQGSIVTRLPMKNAFCIGCVSKQNSAPSYSAQSGGMAPAPGFGFNYDPCDFFKDKVFINEVSTINVYRTLFTVSHNRGIMNKVQHTCTTSEVFDQHTVCILLFVCLSGFCYFC